MKPLPKTDERTKDEELFTVLHHDRITFVSVPILQCYDTEYLRNVHRGGAQTYNVILNSVHEFPKVKNEKTRRRLFKFDIARHLMVSEPTWDTQVRVLRIGDRKLITIKALKHINDHIFRKKKAHPSMISSFIPACTAMWKKQ
jgi:hypothetical protein